MRGDPYGIDADPYGRDFSTLPRDHTLGHRDVFESHDNTDLQYPQDFQHVKRSQTAVFNNFLRMQ